MKTPWHLWLVGALALIWNAYGATDYVMTQTGNPVWLAQFSQEQVAYIEGYPAWVQAFWALAIWLSVGASILLLLRRRWAVPAFLAATLCLAVAALYNFVLADTSLLAVAGPGVYGLWGMIAGVSLGLWLYSRAMAIRGVLA